MTGSWQAVKKALDEETRKWSAVCPDKLKRFHYGLITHSDAGKYAHNQYLGHYVNLYGFYFAESSMIVTTIEGMVGDLSYDLEQLKDLLRRFTPTYTSYSGQNILGSMAKRVLSCLDTLNSKDDLLELLGAWACLVARLHWWCHWYFPWNSGPAVSRRVSKEDVKEIQRLLETPWRRRYPTAASLKRHPASVGYLLIDGLARSQIQMKGTPLRFLQIRVKPVSRSRHHLLEGLP